MNKRLTYQSKLKLKTTLALRSPIYSEVLSMRFSDIKNIINQPNTSNNSLDLNQIASIEQHDIRAQLININHSTAGNALDKLCSEIIINHLSDELMLDESLASIRKKRALNIAAKSFKKGLIRLREIGQFNYGSRSFLEKLYLTLNQAELNNTVKQISFLIIAELVRPSTFFYTLLGALKKLKLNDLESIKQIFNHYEKLLYFQTDNEQYGTAELEFSTDTISLTQEANQIIQSIQNQASRNHISIAIKQRYEHLLKIAHLIIKIQKPLKLNSLNELSQKDIARQTGLSESTISRLLNHTYVKLQDSNKTIKLKSLTEKSVIPNTNITQTLLKNLITQLTKDEPHNAPYSDIKITKYINRQFNIKLSRRVITKYRNQLKIGNTHTRKRYYLLKAFFN
ncbi:hypothetical protein L3V82_09650 [Thiotrichales bacterium 19S3-7]|nr:hypothetical protein [Thiotrichales bacterium 19S3-7]MCF6802422.1 hypothetical protein [Thiotrichales bacterium 19S3-11]